MTNPDARVKLICGHKVPRPKERGGDTAWCPTCKRDLFTGWPEHMEENARMAEQMKDAVVKYLDDCIDTGVEPRISAVVNATESIVTAHSFSRGRRTGEAINDD